MHFARLELEDRTVRVVSRVETAALDCLFDHGLRGVSGVPCTGCRSASISSVELADAYLDHVVATTSGLGGA